MKKIIVVCLYLLASTAFAQNSHDWHTQSNYQDIISTHIQLDLTVDFEHQQLSGSIEHTLKRIDPKVKIVTLDTRALDIHKASALVDGQWLNTTFSLDKADPIRGSKLTIQLPADASKIRIEYNSRPEASGLQWLTPQQTADKKHPFMFSQSQAIHARSWMPIQDTPSMRVTYGATIKTDPAMRAVMSANNSPERSADGVYHFEMPQAIPPYLIAIAAGDIYYKAMSRQTGIYSEMAYLDIAAKEFEDTQSMIDATEKLFGKYRWNQYDLLILPPSFPFGGMENPRLSFITPTSIAGDKSLVSLIAHELAHSWSGNLVTNATWRDLWLNEGFTSYVENRIMEVVYGRDRAVMEQALAAQDLADEMAELPADDTILHVTVEDRDPDDAFSGVPYVKGQLFLIYLEEKFGRDKFDTFVKEYFNNHAFQSLDTPEFVEYLDSHLLKKYPGIVSRAKIDQWVNEAGLPEDAPQPHSDAFKNVQQHIDSWINQGASLADIPSGKWSVHEWLYFINNLPADISIERMAELDKAFNLTESSNSEIAHAWLLLSVKRGYDKVMPRLANYLETIGRQKLILPLYRELLKNPQYRDFAGKVYQQARPGYHPLAQGSVDWLFDNIKKNDSN